jgi:putative MFS transporter
LVGFLMGAFVAAIAMGYVPAEETPVMVTGSLLSFFMLGAWGCVYAYTPENYPTAIRGMGSAYPSGFSRIGAFSGPYLCKSMFTDWGLTLHSIMWIFGAVLVVISVVVLAFGYEPKGKNVEVYGDVQDGLALEKEASFHVVTTPVQVATPVQA